MANKLKIYACSGIGNENVRYTYWLDNTKTVSNTMAVNTLLALINRNNIEILRLVTMTNEQKLANLNDIDVYVLCLQAAQNYENEPDKLKRAGAVIGSMIAEDEFNCNSFNNGERDEHLDALIEKANSLIVSNKSVKPNKDFEQWYNENVIKLNKHGFTEDQQEEITEILEELPQKIKGIGKVDWTQYDGGKWMENPDLAKFLTDGGTYFLYMYFTDEQLNRLPEVFRAKKEKQVRTYNYCKRMYLDCVYGSEQTMREVIRAGIVDEFGGEPEDICEAISLGKEVKPINGAIITWLVGLGLSVKEAIEVIISVLAVIGATLVAIIKTICDTVYKTNAAKYGSLKKDIIETSVPEDDDYDGLDYGGISLGSGKNWMWIAIAAIGAALLLKK